MSTFTNVAPNMAAITSKHATLVNDLELTNTNTKNKKYQILNKKTRNVSEAASSSRKNQQKIVKDHGDTTAEPPQTHKIPPNFTNPTSSSVG